MTDRSNRQENYLNRQGSDHEPRARRPPRHTNARTSICTHASMYCHPRHTRLAVHVVGEARARLDERHTEHDDA